MPRVPYDPSLRLGRGFLSYDHTPKMLDAVVFTDATVNAGAQRADVEFNEVVLPDPSAKADASPAPTAVSPENTKQIVSYSLKMVEKASDVTDSLNISAALQIQDGAVSASGSGSYIDATSIKSSDINFLITVTVINDFRAVPFDATLAPWPSSADSKDVFPAWLVGNDRAAQLFTDIYGDSFVSGHHIGGQFNALVTIHTEDTQKQKDIKANVKFSVSAISGQGEFGMLDQSGISDSDTTITVAWQGGGQIKAQETPWDMKTMIDVAKMFPLHVAQNPAIFATEVTEYKYLKDYWVKFGQHNLKPQDFGFARWITSILLDQFVEFKHIVDVIDRILKSYPDKLKLRSGMSALPAREDIIKERLNCLQTMMDMRDWVDVLKDASKKYTIADIFKFEDPNLVSSRLPIYERPEKTIPGQPVKQVEAPPIAPPTPQAAPVTPPPKPQEPHAIPAGTYYIQNAQSNTVLDVEGGNRSIGTRIQGYEQLHNGNQTWIVTPTANANEYTIKNPATGNYASPVQTQKTAQFDGSSLETHNEPAVWLIEPGTVTGAYAIINNTEGALKGRRLDLANGLAANGTYVIVWPANSPPSANQQWKFVAA